MRGIHPIKWLAIVCTSVYIVHLMYMLEVIEKLSRRWPKTEHETDNLVNGNADRKEGNAVVDNNTQHVKSNHPIKEAGVFEDNSRLMLN